MMRKIFFWLLKRYCVTEKDRVQILENLWNGVFHEYYEQTMHGNIGNFQIEVMMSNPWIRYAAVTFDSSSLDMIKANVDSGVEEALVFLEGENPEKILGSPVEEIVQFRRTQ